MLGGEGANQGRDRSRIRPIRRIRSIRPIRRIANHCLEATPEGASHLGRALLQETDSPNGIDQRP
ncbi:MAG TPA: hypothetical protein DEW46_09870 [Verrucomicrobia bacterium]|nr:hypothetical protein [Verrucomicrobiota bacterium]